MSNTEIPRLDAELLLMHVLKIDHAKLLAQQEIKLTEPQEIKLNALVERRLSGEPIAYILGEKAFWSLDLNVSPDVLIPRPDTECLIDYVLVNYMTQPDLKIADIGTGSGAIAIALAYEKPDWILHATDISKAALTVAKANADKYQRNNVQFYQGDLCGALPDRDYDILISNPPYVEENDPHLVDLQFEPQAALVSGQNGLSVIRQLVWQAPSYLKPDGFIILEHGYNQASQVASLLQKTGFIEIQSHRDLAGNLRFTTAKKKGVITCELEKSCQKT